ncbi:hypothetical protein AAVH_09201 [Aphelenchoides avenae]|nr:hypothetical protein AAVH_09201 [Aphelenchus avenae]
MSTTETELPATTSAPSHTHLVLIIVIIVLAVALLISIIILIYCCWRKKKLSKKPQPKKVLPGPAAKKNAKESPHDKKPPPANRKPLPPSQTTITKTKTGLEPPSSSDSSKRNLQPPNSTTSVTLGSQRSEPTDTNKASAGIKKFVRRGSDSWKETVTVRSSEFSFEIDSTASLPSDVRP